MTKRGTRLFFLGGTLTATLVLLVLTVDSHRQFPRLTHADQITPAVVAGKHVWHRNNCVNCHTLMGEGAYYAPDLTKQAQGAESFQLASIRLTAQITPRNKFNYHQDLQWPCNGSSFTPGGDGCRSQDDTGAFVGSLGLGGLTATTSPETAGLRPKVSSTLCQSTF